MSQATRFQQNLTDENLRKLSITSSDTAKHVRKSKSTASDFNVESLLKKQRFNFIAYKNMSSEKESSLKYFNNTFRFLIFVSSTVETVSQNQQFSEID